MRCSKTIVLTLSMACSLFSSVCFSQGESDTPQLPVKDSLTITATPTLHIHPVRPFSFLTHVPGNLARIWTAPFQKGTIRPMAVIAGVTLTLLVLDEPIIHSTGEELKEIGIPQQESFHRLIGIGNMELIKYPGNFNSFFYYLGETAPSLLMAGGFYLYGKLAHDTRAGRTASEITESFLSTVLTIQTLKRITGRQSPNRATQPGGKWHWFPSLKAFSKDITNYIAYPSGHMGNMMSVVTILAQNYPEKKWIRPLGYAVIGLTALSQLNNKTHWASDFPLGLGIGYLSAKITHKRNQLLQASKRSAEYY